MMLRTVTSLFVVFLAIGIGTIHGHERHLAPEPEPEHERRLQDEPTLEDLVEEIEVLEALIIEVEGKGKRMSMMRPKCDMRCQRRKRRRKRRKWGKGKGG